VLAEDSDNQDEFVLTGIVDALFGIAEETRLPQLKLHVMEAMSNFVYHKSLSKDGRLLRMELPIKY
jgi:hypothetical protein